MKTLNLLIIGTMLMLITACNAGNYNSGNANGYTLSMNGALNAQPNPAEVYVSQEMQIQAVGGMQPYTYVSNGACSVGLNSGVVTAPNTSGTCTITVTDYTGTVVTEVVNMIPLGQSM
jgi:hypothetical protein